MCLNKFEIIKQSIKLTIKENCSEQNYSLNKLKIFKFKKVDFQNAGLLQTNTHISNILNTPNLLEHFELLESLEHFEYVDSTLKNLQNIGSKFTLIVLESESLIKFTH